MLGFLPVKNTDMKDIIETPKYGSSVEDVLEIYRQQFRQHGNDFDQLQISMLMILAGQYREAMSCALKVQPTSSLPSSIPEFVSKSMAHSAFLDAEVRAQPLYQLVAREIEGDRESYETMENYFRRLDELRSNSDW